MKRSKNTLAIILALAMCLTMLAACGTPTTPTPAATPAPTAAPTAAPAAPTAAPATLPEEGFVMPTEPITMSFFWWGNDARAEAVEAAIDLFTTKYPNVTINPEPTSVAFAEVIEAMITRVAAGTEADINQVNYSWIHTFARGNNPFADLRSFADIIDFDQFLDSDIGLMSLPDGQIGGLPHNMNARMLLVNTVFLQDYGLNEIPRDFNAWVALADQISADNVTIDAGNNKYAHVPFSNLDIDHFILAMLFSMTGKENVVDGKFNYTVNEIKAVFDLLLEFDAAGGQPSFENQDPANNEQNAVWTSGRAFSSFQWINNPQTPGNAYGGGDRLGEMLYAPWPMPNGNLVAVARPGMGHAISNKSSYPDVAAYFLNFFYTDPDAIRAVGTQLGIPIARDAFAILDGDGVIHPLQAQGLELMNSLPVAPMGAFWEEGSLRNPRYLIYDEMRTGRIDSQQAAERLVAEQQDALDIMTR